MKRRLVVFLGMMLPLLAVAQTAPDLVAQGNEKKIHGDLKGATADYSQAIADATKAIALNPTNAVAFTNRGNAREAKGDLSDALADYTQAITLDPHHVRAFLNRGNIKNLQKNYGAAIKDYTAAIALDPKNVAAFYNRAGAERALSDYAGAKADYSKVIDLNPADVQAYLNRAVLLMVQGKWDDAASDLNTSLRLIPEERQAYPRVYLWIVDVKKGRMDKASKELTGYLEHSPKTLATTWGWQIATFLAGQVNESTFLTSASSFQLKKDRGQVAQSFYFAGLKQVAAGNKTAAAKFFRKCEKTGNPALHEFILAREELKLLGGHP